jgi:hypothetical protein
MSLIINLSRLKWVLLLSLHFLLTSVSYAELELNHCTPCGNDCYDCGNVLVGAALLEPQAIKWKGNEYRTIIILEAGGAFGFSGKSNYLSESKQQNMWIYKSTTHMTVEAAAFSSTTPPMGHYFAPNKPGLFENPNRYSTQFIDNFGNVVSPREKEVDVRGTGIADENTAITLKVDLNKQGGELLCTTDDKTKCPCQDETGEWCQEIVEPKGNFIFTVTPQVNSTNLPDGVSEDNVKHVLIDLIFNEENTNCESQQQSFEILNNITPNSFNIDQYYHYLHSRGPTLTSPECRFAASFIVSKNKPFQILAKNLRLTEKDGYASITFAVRGHYDPTDPAKWPGSQPTFRLKTQGQLTVIVKGDGKITSSSPAGINECTSTGSGCAAQFPAGEVQLIPEPNNTDVIWGDNCPEGKVNVVTGHHTFCTVKFGPLGGWKFRPAHQEEGVIESNAEFYGTILVNHQRLPNRGVLAGGAEVDIVATVEPEPEHVDQWSHLLLSFDQTLWLKTDQYPVFPWTLWGVLDENFDFFDNIPDNPVTQKLSKQLKINIFNGIFPPELTGTYDVLVGYRLINTGEIVFNPIPISFTVQ